MVLCVSVVVSALASGVVAWSTTSRMIDGLTRTPISPVATSTQPIASSTTPVTPATSFTPPIAVEARRGESIFPPAITERKLPSVALVVRDATIPLAKDRTVLAQDHVVAEAVAMSADGWFMTTDGVLAHARPQDCSLVWNGTAYTPTSIVRDTYTGLLFFKIPVNNILASGVASRTDTDLGTPVWLESRPSRLQFVSIDDMRASSGASDLVGGDVVTRRYLVHAPNDLLIGAPAWDGSGRLVGLVDGGAAGAWHLIPAHVANSALSALLSGSAITHATLGIHDVSDDAFVVGTSSTVRMRGGVVLAPDHRAGLPAVTRKGPSDGKLREGDVIERVENEVLDGTVELSELLLEYPAGTQLTLHGSRGDASLDTSVTLGSLQTGIVLK